MIGIVGRWASGGLLVVVGLVLTQSASRAAEADTAPVAAPDLNSAWDRPHLFGDWGGLRTRLLRNGIEPYAWASDEVVGNLSGGVRKAIDQAGQGSFGANIDGHRAFGLADSVFKLRFVGRWGYSQAATAGIPALQQTNEVAGRGQILRLTEMSYQQGLFDNALTVKVGRLPAGGDFYHAYCNFLNNTFCGAQPGVIASGYIYNWPISQWAAIVKVNLTPELYIGAGFFDQNEKYISYDPVITALPSYVGGSKGLLLPVEFGWKPNLAGLPGDYRLGYWRSNWDSVDVVTSAPIRERTGYYVTLRQQVSGIANQSGLTLFANATYTDRHAHVLNWQAYAGFEYMGLPYRPKDGIGFAFGSTRVNPRIADQQRDLNALGLGPGYVQKGEYAFEAWYQLQATGWMTLKFDAQYIKAPGGYSGPANDDAFLLGIKTDVTF